MTRNSREGLSLQLIVAGAASGVIYLVGPERVELP